MDGAKFAVSFLSPLLPFYPLFVRSNLLARLPVTMGRGEEEIGVRVRLRGREEGERGVGRHTGSVCGGEKIPKVCNMDYGRSFSFQVFIFLIKNCKNIFCETSVPPVWCVPARVICPVGDVGRALLVIGPVLPPPPPSPSTSFRAQCPSIAPERTENERSPKPPLSRRPITKFSPPPSRWQSPMGGAKGIKHRRRRPYFHE